MQPNNGPVLLILPPLSKVVITGTWLVQAAVEDKYTFIKQFPKDSLYCTGQGQIR